jgi:2-C-methyl-D-erythritol 4-phosphate cytidylyltransferase/2-C-methyl-D-erythritol 2,4-cyclodiphosphate synthase
MAAMPADVDVVLVHDAARPFIDTALIDRVIEGVSTHGGRGACNSRQGHREAHGSRAETVAATIPRQEIWLAQTPQGFRRDVLTQAIAAGQGDTLATRRGDAGRAGGA